MEEVLDDDVVKEEISGGAAAEERTETFQESLTSTAPGPQTRPQGFALDPIPAGTVGTTPLTP